MADRVELKGADGVVQYPIPKNTAFVYHKTSTVGFEDACPEGWDNSGLGGVLDVKVRDAIGDFQTRAFTTVEGGTGGAVIAALVYKLSDTYYAGIAWTYHTDARYGNDGLTLFKNFNGVYSVSIFSYNL